MIVTTQPTAPTRYDGVEPFPGGVVEQAWTGRRRLHAALTGLFVVLPIAVAAWMLWGHGIRLADPAIVRITRAFPAQ